MSLQDHVEQLKEWILDEERMVTSLFVAVNLKITLKESSKLLHDFVNESSKKKLSVSYLVSGILKSSQELGVSLIKCSEERDRFQSIQSEIVHSICKGSSLDTSTAFSIDFEAGKCIDDISFLGCPVNKNCVKRVAKKQAVVPTENSLKQNPSLKTNSHEGIAKTEEKTKTNVKQSIKSSGLSNFLTKGPSKSSPKKTEAPVKSEPEASTSEVKESKPIKQEQTSSPSVKSKTTQSVKASPKETCNKENKKKASKNRQSDSLKKRKRIQVCDSDSNSSDIFGDEDEEEPKEPEEEPEVIQSTKSALQPINKRRKVVDKTFIDEDGFMVTTTEYTYEDVAMDDEKKPEAPAKTAKEETKTPVEKSSKSTDKKPEKGKKGKKPASGTQTTLTSFFKRQ